MNDRDFISERLIKIETLVNERWEVHQRHSDEKWGEVKTAIDKIFSRLDSLPCDRFQERLTNTDKRISGVIKGLYFVVIFMLLPLIFLLIRHALK